MLSEKEIKNLIKKLKIYQKYKIRRFKNEFL